MDLRTTTPVTTVTVTDHQHLVTHNAPTHPNTRSTLHTPSKYANNPNLKNSCVHNANNAAMACRNRHTTSEHVTLHRMEQKGLPPKRKTTVAIHIDL
tara:strand:+ start:113 stop:403 length:291 start_codon:yes stop_codon:yes gene_type:complete